MNADENSLRLPKKYFVTKKRDFDAAFEKGRSFYTSRMRLVVAPNGLGHTRLGLVVKKTGTAVERNITRRIVREAFRLVRSGLKEGVDVLVIPRRGMKPDLETVKGDFLKLAGKPS